MSDSLDGISRAIGRLEEGQANSAADRRQMAETLEAMSERIGDIAAGVTLLSAPNGRVAQIETRLTNLEDAVKPLTKAHEQRKGAAKLAHGLTGLLGGALALGGEAIAKKLGWLAIIGIILAAGAVAAFAAPPENADPHSPMAEWFSGVRHPRLGRCYDIADGKFVQARKIAGGWQVLLDDGWRDVPPDAVLGDQASPNGEPVVWIFQGAIRCFIPSGGGA